MRMVKMIRVCTLLAVAMFAISWATSAEAGRFGDRLRGHRGGNDCCEPACEPVCCEPAPCCEPAKKRCRLFGGRKKDNCCEPTCCEPAPCAAPCAEPAPCPAPCEPAPCCEETCCEDPCCEREGFFSKLRNKFKNRGGNDCCDPCAPACGC